MARLIPDIVEYVGVTQTLRITNLTLAGELVTDAMPGVTVAYTVIDSDGLTIDDGTLAYVPGTDATWEGDVNVPNLPGETVRVELTADRGSSHGEWKGKIRIKA